MLTDFKVQLRHKQIHSCTADCRQAPGWKQPLSWAGLHYDLRPGYCDFGPGQVCTATSDLGTVTSVLGRSEL